MGWVGFGFGVGAGLGWFGLGRVSSGRVGSGQVRSGQVRSSLAWLGWVGLGLGWFGLVSLSVLIFPCQYYSTNAPHLTLTLYDLSNCQCHELKRPSKV